MVVCAIRCAIPPTKELLNVLNADLTPGVWNIDASHSRIGFVARHLMVSKVRGNFGTFNATVTICRRPDGLQGRGERRDCDVEMFPTMTLVSTGIDKNGGDYVLHTDLTIKDITKPVDFELEFDGVNDDPWGGTRAGFTAEAEVNRKDWGLEWNVAVETGGVVLGDKIKIQLEIEAIKASA